MADQQGDKVPYPSWEELRARSEFDPSLTIEEHMSRPPPPDPPGLALYTFRNLWHLSGEFPACVSVSRIKRIEENAEPFFKSGGDGGTWHETADWPMTEPKVSSIDVSSYELKVLESDWVAFHLERCDNDGEWVEYGELGHTDLKPSIDEMEPSNGECRSDTKCLVRCCGQERPVGKSGQKLTVTPSPGHDFVTVKDYISAVHPWLMSRRDGIMLAKKVAYEYPERHPESREWLAGFGPWHRIEAKDDWVRQPSKTGKRVILINMGG